MPTIVILCPELTVTRRRRIALRITQWLARRGVKAAHVVVRFIPSPEESIFSGGTALEHVQPHKPTDRNTETAALPPYAMVSCCVAKERDDAFRVELAREIGAALQLPEQRFFYVRFEPVERHDVLYSTSGELISADIAH